jgi:hypothetical protein
MPNKPLPSERARVCLQRWVTHWRKQNPDAEPVGFYPYAEVCVDCGLRRPSGPPERRAAEEAPA